MPQQVGSFRNGAVPDAQPENFGRGAEKDASIVEVRIWT